VITDGRTFMNFRMNTGARSARKRWRSRCEHFMDLWLWWSKFGTKTTRYAIR
jgi:hypothetical protein